MSERDYEKDPIILRATIEVYVYEEVSNIKERVQQFEDSNVVQESALELVGNHFSNDCGLNECNIKVVEQ